MIFFFCKLILFKGQNFVNIIIFTCNIFTLMFNNVLICVHLFDLKDRILLYNNCIFNIFYINYNLILLKMYLYLKEFIHLSFKPTHTHTYIYIYIYIQWGNKVFSQPPIVQVLPLKKMREACNFHHRYTSTMRDKIRKKSIKSHCRIFKECICKLWWKISIWSPTNQQDCWLSQTCNFFFKKLLHTSTYLFY